jgi:hypothetical protein
LKNISPWFYSSLSLSNTRFKQLGYHRTTAVNILQNTLHNLYTTYNNHFKNKRLKRSFFYRKNKWFFPLYGKNYLCNGILAAPANSPLFPFTILSNRRRCTSVSSHHHTIPQFSKYEESTRNVSDCRISQIRYQGVSLKLFLILNNIWPGQWSFSGRTPASSTCL